MLKMTDSRRLLPRASWIFALVATTAAAWAAPLPSPIVITPGRVSPPIEVGTTIGGQARDEFSLLAIRNEPSEKGERLVLSYGDRFGKPLKGEPGYFHVAIDHGAKRLVIDLAQMQMTAVGPQDLSKILANSKLVATSEMSMDPIDSSTNITLHYKVPVKVKVGAAAEDAAKISIEVTPISGALK